MAALDALNSVDQSRMGKNERKYFCDCQKQIERYEGFLAEMLNFIVKKYIVRNVFAVEAKIEPRS